MAESKNTGVLLNMTGCVQAPFGCYEGMSSVDQASTRGICNARDLLEASKAAYGVFGNLSTIKSKNNLQHVSVKNVQRALRGGALNT